MNKFILLVVFLGYSGICVGQVAEGLTPLQRKQLTVLSEPATLYKGFFRIGYELKYSRPGRTFDRYGTKRPPEEFNFAGNYVNQLLSLTVGLSDRIQVSVALPYANESIKGLVKINQTGNQLLPYRVYVRTKGIKDLQTEIRVQVLKETKTIPSVVAGFGAWLPTGSNVRTITNKVSTGEYRYEDITGGVGTSMIATLQVRKIVYPYLFAAEFNYFFGSDGEIIENNQAIEVLGANSAVWQITTGMHLNEWITLTGKLFYQRLSFNGDIKKETAVPLYDNSRKELLTFDPTLTFQFGRIRAQQVVSIPMAGKTSNAELEYIAGIQYIF